MVLIIGVSLRGFPSGDNDNDDNIDLLIMSLLLVVVLLLLVVSLLLFNDRDDGFDNDAASGC